MEQLQKFGDKLIGYLESAEVFLSQNLPDFVNQFIAYEQWRVSTEIYLPIILLLLGFLLACLLILFSIFSDDSNNRQGFVWGTLLTCLANIFFLMWGWGCYKDIKKLELAPKVYLVESAKRLFTEAKK